MTETHHAYASTVAGRAFLDAMRLADLRESLFVSRVVLAVAPNGTIRFANAAGLTLLKAETLAEVVGRSLLRLAPRLRSAMQAGRHLAIGQSARTDGFVLRRRPGLPARLTLESEGPHYDARRRGLPVDELVRRMGLADLKTLDAPDALGEAATHLAKRAERFGFAQDEERIALATPDGLLFVESKAETRTVPSPPPSEPQDESPIEWRLDPEDRFLSGPDALIETSLEALDPRLHEAVARRCAFQHVVASWPLPDGTTARASVSGRPIVRPDGSYRGLRGRTVLLAADSVDEEAGREESVGEEAVADDGVTHEPILDAADFGDERGPVGPQDGAEEGAQRGIDAAVDGMADAADDDADGVRDDVDEEVSALSSNERDAFDQIASLLRMEDGLSLDAFRMAADIADGAPSADVDPQQRKDVPAELDAVPLALIVYRDGDVLFLNKAAGQMLGYGSAAELVLHGGIEALFAGREDGAPAAGPSAVPTRRILRADGTGLDLVTGLRAITWQGETAFLLTLRRPDIAAPDNGAPLALPADALIDVLPLGILSLAGDGNVHSANEMAASLLGQPVDALIGASFTSLLCEPHRRGALDDLHALMRGEKSPARAVRGLGTDRPDAEVPDLDLTLRRLDLGEGFGLVAILQDATERRIDDRARQCAELELGRLKRERSAFLKRISHELRTPLNAIVGFAEVMMEERFGPLGSTRYRDYAHDIEESGRRLVSMIGDLMDLVRLQEDGAANLEDEIALNDIVSTCVANVYARAGERRVIVRCSLAQNLPPIRADRESLIQIVANLLDNSVRLTQAGGQVIVSTGPLENGGVAVRVRDGSRLDAGLLRAAVSPFDLELETAPSGTAPSLGLPLTRALAQANGADFSIDSEAGRGTVTQVIFPPDRVSAA